MWLITERNLSYFFLYILLLIALINMSIMLIRLILKKYYGRVLISMKAADYRVHYSALATNIALIISTLLNLDTRMSTLVFLKKYQESNSIIDATTIDKANENILFLKYFIIVFVMFAFISLIKALTRIKVLEKGIYSNKCICKWNDIKAFSWENESENSITLRLKTNRKPFKYIKLSIKKENKKELESILLDEIPNE